MRLGRWHHYLLTGSPGTQSTAFMGPLGNKLLSDFNHASHLFPAPAPGAGLPGWIIKLAGGSLQTMRLDLHYRPTTWQSDSSTALPPDQSNHAPARLLGGTGARPGRPLAPARRLKSTQTQASCAKSRAIIAQASSTGCQRLGVNRIPSSTSNWAWLQHKHFTHLRNDTILQAAPDTAGRKVSQRTQVLVGCRDWSSPS